MTTCCDWRSSSSRSRWRFPALRGSIFDRNGQPAGQEPARRIDLTSIRSTFPMPAWRPTCCPGCWAWIAPSCSTASSAKLRGSGFLWIKRKVDSSEADAARAA